MKGPTVPSLNGYSAVNNLSALVLKVQIPCISNLNNKEMITKDSLVPLKEDTSSLSNTYRGLGGKTNKKLKTFMAHILKRAFEFCK